MQTQTEKKAKLKLNYDKLLRKFHLEARFFGRFSAASSARDSEARFLCVCDGDDKRKASEYFYANFAVSSLEAYPLHGEHRIDFN